MKYFLKQFHLDLISEKGIDKKSFIDFIKITFSKVIKVYQNQMKYRTHFLIT